MKLVKPFLRSNYLVKENGGKRFTKHMSVWTFSAFYCAESYPRILTQNEKIKNLKNYYPEHLSRNDTLIIVFSNQWLVTSPYIVFIFGFVTQAGSLSL